MSSRVSTAGKCTRTRTSTTLRASCALAGQRFSRCIAATVMPRSKCLSEKSPDWDLLAIRQFDIVPVGIFAKIRTAAGRKVDRSADRKTAFAQGLAGGVQLLWGQAKCHVINISLRPSGPSQIGICQRRAGIVGHKEHQQKIAPCQERMLTGAHLLDREAQVLCIEGDRDLQIAHPERQFRNGAYRPGLYTHRFPPVLRYQGA